MALSALRAMEPRVNPEMRFRPPAARRRAPPCAAAVDAPGNASSPGQAHRLAGGAACATAADVRGSGALSPTRGPEAPLRLACRSLCSYRTSSRSRVWLKALWPSVLYLLDDPSCTVSDCAA